MGPLLRHQRRFHASRRRYRVEFPSQMPCGWPLQSVCRYRFVKSLMPCHCSSRLSFLENLLEEVAPRSLKFSRTNEERSQALKSIKDKGKSSPQAGWTQPRGRVHFRSPLLFTARWRSTLPAWVGRWARHRDVSVVEEARGNPTKVFSRVHAFTSSPARQHLGVGGGVWQKQTHLQRWQAGEHKRSVLKPDMHITTPICGNLLSLLQACKALLAPSLDRECVQSNTKESASIEFLEVESTKRSIPK